MGFFLIVVVLMTVTMFLPAIGPLLIRLAAVFFLFTLGTLLLSFVVTPHRFGSLFMRF